VRLTAQLLEVEAGRHLWAEHYDRELTDSLALSDEVAKTVAATVAGRLRAATRDRAARTRPEKLAAYDYVLLAEGIPADNEENNRRARKAYQDAIEIDPACATAYAGLAHSHAIDGLFGYTIDFEHSLDQALSYAIKSVALDGMNSKAEWVLGHVLTVRGELAHAKSAFDRALELNPLDADAYVMKGNYLAIAGCPEESVVCHKTAIRLNRSCPGWYIWNLADSYYDSMQYEQALALMKLFVGRHPGFNRPKLGLAATYGQLGRMEEANSVVERILACAPETSLRQEYARKEGMRYLDHWLEGLRKAGLPE
jgi:adenylate cyclase